MTPNQGPLDLAPQLLPCPFCGTSAKAGLGNSYMCGDSECIAANQWVSKESWNRRAPVNQGGPLDLEAIGKKWTDLYLAGSHTLAAGLFPTLEAEVRRLRAPVNQGGVGRIPSKIEMLHNIAVQHHARGKAIEPVQILRIIEEWPTNNDPASPVEKGPEKDGIEDLSAIAAEAKIQKGEWVPDALDLAVAAIESAFDDFDEEEGYVECLNPSIAFMRIVAAWGHLDNFRRAQPEAHARPTTPEGSRPVYGIDHGAPGQDYTAEVWGHEKDGVIHITGEKITPNAQPPKTVEPLAEPTHLDSPPPKSIEGGKDQGLTATPLKPDPALSGDASEPSNPNPIPESLTSLDLEAMDKAFGDINTGTGKMVMMGIALMDEVRRLRSLQPSKSKPINPTGQEPREWHISWDDALGHEVVGPSLYNQGQVTVREVLPAPQGKGESK